MTFHTRDIIEAIILAALLIWKLYDGVVAERDHRRYRGR
jgi:hypothetical protein